MYFKESYMHVSNIFIYECIIYFKVNVFYHGIWFINYFGSFLKNKIFWGNYQKKKKKFLSLRHVIFQTFKCNILNLGVFFFLRGFKPRSLINVNFMYEHTNCLGFSFSVFIKGWCLIFCNDKTMSFSIIFLPSPNY